MGLTNIYIINKEGFMKKTAASVRLTIFLSVILTIAFIICMIWNLFVLTPYHWYIKDFENIYGASLYYDYEESFDDFYCRVSVPTFLANKGFLCIRSESNNIQFDSDGKVVAPKTPRIYIWIWPSVFRETEYMLEVSCLNSERTGSESYSSYITFEKKEDGSYEIRHEIEDPLALEVYNENRETVEDMLDCISKIWSFNGLEDIKNGLECKYNNE